MKCLNKKKRYVEGGVIPYDQLGMIGGSMIDAIAPPNQYGVRKNFAAGSSGALKGAGAGAAIGSIIPGFGTAGAIIGGGIGAVKGIIDNNKMKEVQAEHQSLLEQMEIGRSAAVLRNYNQGSNTNQIYAKYGGELPGDPPSKPVYNPKTGITKFYNRPVTDSVSYERNDPRLLENPDLVYGRLAFEQNPKLQRITLGNTPEGFTNMLLTGYGPPEGVNLPKPSTLLNPYGDTATYTGGVQNPVMERKKYGGKLKALNGGVLKSLSSNAVEVIGKSHEDGGVDIAPNIEVEDNETISGDFVYSDALGFAKQHKKIATAIGKLEKKEPNNITNNTLKRLKERELLLQEEQEATKEALGLTPLNYKYGGKVMFGNLGGLVFNKK